MTDMWMTRRRLVLGAGALAATGALAACNNGIGSNGASQIDARVSATESFLFSQYPGTRDL
ncbi:MAG: twin-arginine translocation pathway signal, partial [Tabrizicola sp.]